MLSMPYVDELYVFLKLYICDIISLWLSPLEMSWSEFSKIIFAIFASSDNWE